MVVVIRTGLRSIDHIAGGAGTHRLVRSGMILAAVWLLAAVGRGADTVAGADLTLNFGRTNGFIRALHGGNNGPLGSGETVDLTAFHRELNIPFTRLHDSAWPYPDIVDLHAIFPDFGADPENAKAYRFGPTDDYLRAITNTGSRIVYRLGESIEHAKRKRYVHPPSDLAKWARICVGVIRHYNEGWADGHRLGIDYWEIWNEPENRPAMWTGSAEQYYELYTVAAKTIKARWPALKVGGPSLGHQGSSRGGVLEPSEFLRGFLDHVHRTGAPLDFFSWHGYSDDPGYYAERARALRRYLDQEGFRATESHLNEWNYLPDHDWQPMLSQAGERREKWYARQGGPEGAAFAAAVLISLQDAPVDIANYYSADNQPFGLFTIHGAPKATFEAFRAFRALQETPVRVEGPSKPAEGQWCLGGLSPDGGMAGFLLAVTHGSRATPVTDVDCTGLPWRGGTQVDLEILTGSGERLTRTMRWPAGFGRIQLNTPAPALVWGRLSQVDGKARTGRTSLR